MDHMVILAPIAEVIRTARQRKGLSQRALSARIGVPQSHLSRIENGAVDLQTSSLMEIARALDLEVMLVPRQLVPTVQALSHGRTEEAPPAYRLDEDETNG